MYNNTVNEPINNIVMCNNGMHIGLYNAWIKHLQDSGVDGITIGWWYPKKQFFVYFDKKDNMDNELDDEKSVDVEQDTKE